MWSLYPAEEEHRTDGRRATRKFPSAMHEPTDVLDEEGAESDDDFTIPGSSESSLESQLEQDLSDFEAEMSDCEVERASSDLKPTAGCLDSSPHDERISKPREEDAEEMKSLGFEGALEDLMLRRTRICQRGRLHGVLFLQLMPAIEMRALEIEEPHDYLQRKK